MIPRQKQQSECANGQMPSMAPLANPYVPFQLEDPPKYKAHHGMIRGTLFPGLDLPFLGKANTHALTATPMTELQALNFAIQELQLYLDTHKNDQEAISLYRKYQQMYRTCRNQYEAQNGPLNQLQKDSGDHFQWLNGPWPWEYCKNKGV